MNGNNLLAIRQQNSCLGDTINDIMLAHIMDSDLEAICDLIFEKACEVNEACFYLAPSQMEKNYQAIMAYELSNAEIIYHSEVTIELLYKGFPLQDARADFVIHPGGPNNFESDIIVEVKHSKQDKTNRDKARLQLLGYLYNAPRHSAAMLKPLEYGIVLHWPIQDEKKIWDEDPASNAKFQSPVPRPRMELWHTSNASATEFELLKTWS